jgi:hypothetical protein
LVWCFNDKECVQLLKRSEENPYKNPKDLATVSIQRDFDTFSHYLAENVIPSLVSYFTAIYEIPKVGPQGKIHIHAFGIKQF